MSNVDRIERMVVGSRRLSWAAMVLTLVVLAGTIALTTHQVRERIRMQIIGRDAAVLHAVLQTQLEEMGDADPLEEVDDSLRQLTAVLVTSRLSGVLGARLFDVAGEFVVSFPPTVREASLSDAELDRAWRLQPGARLEEGVDLRTLFYSINDDDWEEGSAVSPLLVVNVPLHTAADPEPRGVAQFLIEGHTLAAELARLDQHLTFQGGMAFLMAGAILVGSWGWAFGRLRRSQRSLTQRTNALQRANEELARAARTAAVGAVTAHLIHGLKSPLAGLQNFVSAQGRGDGQGDSSEWETALVSARRMQTMINRTIQVLREEESSLAYDLTLGELADEVVGRTEALACERGVKLEREVIGEGRLSNRTANLVMLILVNLIENGLQATPAGGRVRMEIRRELAGVAFEVNDQGSGVSEEVRNDLFAPRRSTRERGSGIGLAISKQLANHLGATLEMLRTSTEGTVFAMVLPDHLVQDEAGADAGRR